MSLNRKTNQENKETDKRKKQQSTKKNKKEIDTLPTKLVFPKDFSQEVYLFLSLKSIKQAKTIYVMERCYLLCAISLN